MLCSHNAEKYTSICVINLQLCASAEISFRNMFFTCCTHVKLSAISSLFYWPLHYNACKLLAFVGSKNPCFCVLHLLKSSTWTRISYKMFVHACVGYMACNNLETWLYYVEHTMLYIRTIITSIQSLCSSLMMGSLLLFCECSWWMKEHIEWNSLHVWKVYVNNFYTYSVAYTYCQFCLFFEVDLCGTCSDSTMYRTWYSN